MARRAGQGELPVRAVLLGLEALTREGLTIVLVEQNVHLAFSLSDYAYAIPEGRLFTEGPPRLLESRPEIRRAYLGL